MSIKKTAIGLVGQMVGQLGVVVLETSHRDAGAALYDGLAVHTEEHVHLQAVPQPAVSNYQ